MTNHSEHGKSSDQTTVYYLKYIKTHTLFPSGFCPSYVLIYHKTFKHVSKGDTIESVTAGKVRGWQDATNQIPACQESSACNWREYSSVNISPLTVTCRGTRGSSDWVCDGDASGTQGDSMGTACQLAFSHHQICKKGMTDSYLPGKQWVSSLSF